MRSKRPRSDFDPFLRGLLIGLHLADGKTVCARFIERELRVSRATSVRDMRRLADAMPSFDVSVGGSGAVSISTPR